MQPTAKEQYRRIGRFDVSIREMHLPGSLSAPKLGAVPLDSLVTDVKMRDPWPLLHKPSQSGRWPEHGRAGTPKPPGVFSALRTASSCVCVSHHAVSERPAPLQLSLASFKEEAGSVGRGKIWLYENAEVANSGRSCKCQITMEAAGRLNLIYETVNVAFWPSVSLLWRGTFNSPPHDSIKLVNCATLLPKTHSRFCKLVARLPY